ncbi:MAG: sensor N-terminal transmembrane domain-containing protein [Proteobacteria bacterium]|nr:sensor N-terminal transmembrane domain-containing protein [Pseudomonadota bacterium]MDE2411131.1 sensor N-terminal transmembrane domain-containing protein [Sphingomonadales bacterium]
MVERPPVEGGRRRVWTRRTSLTVRILAVNIIALGVMAGSLFYLDSYRKQLLEVRFKLARAEAEITADGLAETPIVGRKALFDRVSTAQKLRLRLYDAKGALILDSNKVSGPAYTFVDPAREPFLPQTAREIDRAMNWVLGTTPVPPYRDPIIESVDAWPELAAAKATGRTWVLQRSAPDETPVISAAAPVGVRGEMLLTTRNARDITQDVRDARSTLAIIIAVTLLISIQLSLFLARTIVQPLRALVRAAVRVRLGRDREVVVPRLPERGDEIGLLARALSDMTLALRHRIDAVETFAADVAHEIKNPLASLRSAIETLGKVEDPALRQKLTGIAAHDVRRIDRLVTEIAEASRIDAELSRTQFVPVDLDALAGALVSARAERRIDDGHALRLVPLGPGPFIVPGDPARLERVLENLVDNALSFSPPQGLVEITLERMEDHVNLGVRDQGPGIPPDAREKVFERFHSLRPSEEDFGSHSGLGLAIARTIVEAHDGTLVATDRDDGQPGAFLVAELPIELEDEE